MNELQSAGTELHIQRLHDQTHRTLRTTHRGRAALLLLALPSLARRRRPGRRST